MKIDIKNIRDYKIAKDTINIDEKIGKRSIASFTVIDENSLHHFNQGLPVEISNYSQEIPIYNGYFMPYKTKARLNYVKGKSQLKFSETDEEILSWEVSETLKNELIQDENGDWRIQENVGQVTFDGSESGWLYVSSWLTDNTVSFSTFVNYNKNSYNVKSSIFGTKNVNSTSDEEGNVAGGLRHYYAIKINKSRLIGYSDELTNTEKVNLFKQWLQTQSNEGNPLTVWYELAVKNPIEINLWEWENQGANYWLTFEEKRTNTYWFLIETFELDLTKFIIPSLSQVSLFDDVEGYQIRINTIADLFISVSTIENLMSQHSTDEVGALKIYLEQENIYGIFELATPRLAEVEGLKHAKPIVQGIQFDKDVRSAGNVYDEYKNGLIHRKTKLVNLGYFNDITKLEVIDDDYYFFKFNNILTYDNDNLLISHNYTRDNRSLVLKIDKQMIENIKVLGTIYEWKLQKSSVSTEEQPANRVGECPEGWIKIINPDLSIVCMREITVWTDVIPYQYVWSETEPQAEDGYRWIETGKFKTIDDVDACKIYCQQKNITLVCEDVASVEYISPILIDFNANEEVKIENSLDTEMRMLIDYRLYYRGFIDSADERYVTQYLENDVLKKVRIHEVVCKDNVYLADKRLIRKSYVNRYCGDIVKDIIKSYLGIEGVKEGIIQQGEFMEEVVFKSIKISKALSRLAEASDFIWDIDNERRLHFMERETNYNEIPITEADCKSISVSVGNMDYRNKQYIEGGKALTDLITETFKGDGANRSFTLSFPCGEKPEIMVDSVLIDDEDIGIKGVDEEKKWYWEKGSNVISQATEETAVPFDTTLRIMYKGLFEVIVSTLNTIEIEKRAELEDNSGIIEAIDEEIDNNSITTSFRSATAKLRKYAVDGKVIKVLTRRNDLHVGQMIRAIIPKHDIDQDVLISQVRIYTQDNVVWHEVELLIGPEVADFYDMFNEAVSKKTRSIYENIQEQEALVQAFEVTKTWGIEDTPNIFRELYPSNTLYPSPSLYPTFEKKQRVLYMEVIQDDETVARVKHIRQNEVNDVLTSIFYLDNATANGTITKLKFFGGYLATEEVGSGVLIDEVTLIDEIDKTFKDVIQIYRLDIKGY